MASTLHLQIILDQKPQIDAERITNTHPMFVHPPDTPELVLIPIKLTVSKNYGLWHQSTMISL